MHTIASIFTMLYKPRLHEVAAALGAQGADKAFPFEWALRVGDSGEVTCRAALEQLNIDELRRVATFWQVDAWYRLDRAGLIDTLCAEAARADRVAPWAQRA
jgi:hypothetical protein